MLGGAFHAIAKEMAGVLFRMSYSSIIRESEDLGAGIFDARGSRAVRVRLDADAHRLAALVHPRLHAQARRATIEEGDVIVHNHPYLGASHTPDVAVAVPIFHEGELLGFAAVTAHVLDVGGSFPGINADAFDVYAEAKLYNGLRWYRRGELNDDLDRMIFDNVRTETMNRGDMNAMLAACQLGRERFLRLVQRYGAGDRDERRVRLDGLLGAHAARARSRRSRTASTRRRPAGWTTTRATAACGCGWRRR